MVFFNEAVAVDVLLVQTVWSRISMPSDESLSETAGSDVFFSIVLLSVCSLTSGTLHKAFSDTLVALISLNVSELPNGREVMSETIVTTLVLGIFSELLV